MLSAITQQIYWFPIPLTLALKLCIYYAFKLGGSLREHQTKSTAVLETDSRKLWWYVAIKKKIVLLCAGTAFPGIYINVSEEECECLQFCAFSSASDFMLTDRKTWLKIQQLLPAIEFVEEANVQSEMYNCFTYGQWERTGKR